MASKPYVVRVSVPYATKWGQSVRLVLSNEQVAHASTLECQHIDGQLIWSAQLSWPKALHYTYRYVVVNEAGTTIDEETRPRTLSVPRSLRLGGTLQLVDEWQVLPTTAPPPLDPPMQMPQLTFNDIKVLTPHDHSRRPRGPGTVCSRAHTCNCCAEQARLLLRPQPLLAGQVRSRKHPCHHSVQIGHIFWQHSTERACRRAVGCVSS